MLLSLILSATFASAQATPNREQITLRGTVQAVDATARTVTIRGETGNVVTLDVPQSVRRLNEVKVGDVVSAVYYDQVSVAAHPAGAPDTDRLEPPIATLDARRAARRHRRAAARDDGDDYRLGPCHARGDVHSTVGCGLLAPSGGDDRREPHDGAQGWRSRGRDADRSGSPRSRARAQAAAPPTTLRNRLTVSVLFGWDNQFSGKMIKEATGQTTGGAPINLDETTYDEVYGRIGMFKIGAGYRTTPRTEAVFNFVWSSSDAAEDGDPDRHGGRDPRRSRSMSNFTEYKYWGIERRPAVVLRPHPLHALRRLPRGRQPAPGHPWHVRRRARQVSRRGSPRRTASSSKSRGRSAWVRPAGVLIGVGPFEVMAETQFRFMGGLSDVDWLVEEGLRDINSESSRWSIPILVGAPDPVLTTLDSRGVAEPSVMPRLVCRRFSCPAAQETVGDAASAACSAW